MDTSSHIQGQQWFLMIVKLSGATLIFLPMIRPNFIKMLKKTVLRMHLPHVECKYKFNVFVDANHARNKINCPLQTGILLYLNRAPILWFSKMQKMVESSTFGSEFVALHIAAEQIKAMRYKLRMMSVPIEGPANVLVGNETVVKNYTIPSSTLQQKHNSICYHFVRETEAAKII